MPRPKIGDKRAAIVRAAAKTIAEDGIGASTASLVKAAAVAEESLFRYFPDRDKLLNELYLELKLNMRRAMVAGFPLTGSLRKRVQHIWNAYGTRGMESPAKRKAMMHLAVSERITDQSKREGQTGFEEATQAMRQVEVQQERLLRRGRGTWQSLPAGLRVRHRANVTKQRRPVAG